VAPSRNSGYNNSANAKQAIGGITLTEHDTFLIIRAQLADGHFPVQVWCEEEESQCIWRVHSTCQDLHSILHTWARPVHVEDDEGCYASPEWHLGLVQEEDFDVA